MRRSHYVQLALMAAVLLAPGPLKLAGLLALAGGGLALRLAGSPVRRAVQRASAALTGRPAPDTLLLGRNPRGAPVTLSDNELSAHGLILGASGAGKTTTLLAILTERIIAGKPTIAIDLKGSPAFTRQLADACGAAGRELRVWTPDGPGHWNPLQYGNATERKDKLIATERFTEPHYQRAAERYVQLALQVTERLHPDRAPTLGEVVELLEPTRLRAAIRPLPAAVADPIEDYLTHLTRDQLSAVHGLGTRLAILSESHTGPYLRPGGDHDLDLRAALDGTSVALFSLISCQYGQLAGQLGTLAVQDLVTAVGHRLRDVAAPELALVGIDEFSALGHDNVSSLLARGREAGISVLLGTQELADLDRAGRGLRDQVLGVTSLKLVHRQEVPTSIDTIARIGGTHEEWDRTYQIGVGPFGAGQRSAGTRRRVQRFNIDPDTIRTLRTGEAVLIVKTPVTRTELVRVAPPRHRDRSESASPRPVRTRPAQAPPPPDRNRDRDRDRGIAPSPQPERPGRVTPPGKRRRPPSTERRPRREGPEL